MSLVVITGGSKGIGLELVNVFLKNNYQVISCASSEKSFNAMQHYSEKLDFYQVDMGSATDIQHFSEHILNKQQDIACVINNVGIYQPMSLDNYNVDCLKKFMDVNLYSACHLNANLMPKLIAQGKGTIINISSVAGLMPLEHSTVYCVSKYALNGYSKGLRLDLRKHGIRVITVSPGATLTSAWDEIAWDGQAISTENFMDAVDVANVIYQAFTVGESMVVEDIVMRPLRGTI